MSGKLHVTNALLKVGRCAALWLQATQAAAADERSEELRQQARARLDELQSATSAWIKSSARAFEQELARARVESTAVH